jgi:hypothetical protein
MNEVSGGPPVKEFDVTDSLEPDPEDPEIDLEGTTRKGRFLFWIVSHSRKADDDGNVKAAASRHRLLATTIPALGGKPLRVEGVYRTLVADAGAHLRRIAPADPCLRQFDLDPMMGSKDGGLSIEGLAFSADATELLIALRSPVAVCPAGKKAAVVLRMKNPEEVLFRKAAARFEAPSLVDVDGRGIRAMEYWPERKTYLMIAGPPGEGGPFTLYRWTGKPEDRPVPIHQIDAAPDTSPEALVFYGNGTDVDILFDEGERPMPDGRRCKARKTPPDKKSFRAQRLRFDSDGW